MPESEIVYDNFRESFFEHTGPFGLHGDPWSAQNVHFVHQPLVPFPNVTLMMGKASKNTSK